MDFAYSIADFIVPRAGALAIAELTLVGAPTLLIPFPFAAEDHQTKNALALVNKDAAVMVTDAESSEKLIPTTLSLINDDDKLKSLSTNILQLAERDSATRIVDEIFKLVKK